MTKMKSKKMTKSTFAIIIMAVAMVAMLAFGGTYAYFTATADNTTTDTLTAAVLELTNGTVAVTANADTDIVPGAYIFGGEDTYEKVELSSKSTAATYVFVEFAVDAKDADEASITLNGQSILDFAINGEGTTWLNANIDGKNVYYREVDASDTATALDFEFSVQFKEGVQSNNPQTGDSTFNTSADAMGATISLEVKAAAIQQLGQDISDVEAVYNAAFAAVVTTDYDAVRGN